MTHQPHRWLARARDWSGLSLVACIAVVLLSASADIAHAQTDGCGTVEQKLKVADDSLQQCLTREGEEIAKARSATKTAGNATEQLEKIEKLFKEREEENRRLTADLNVFQKDLEDKERARRQAMTDLARVQGENSVLLNKIAALQQELDRVKGENERVKAAQVEADRVRAEAERRAKEADARAKKAADDRADADEQRRRLEHERTEAESARKNAEAQLLKANENGIFFKSQRDEYYKKAIGLDAVASGWKDKFDAADRERQDWQRRYNQLEQQWQPHKIECDGLRSSLDKARVELSRCVGPGTPGPSLPPSAELSACIGDVSRLRQNLAEERNRVEHWSSVATSNCKGLVPPPPGPVVSRIPPPADPPLPDTPPSTVLPKHPTVPVPDPRPGDATVTPPPVRPAVPPPPPPVTPPPATSAMRVGEWFVVTATPGGPVQRMARTELEQRFARDRRGGLPRAGDCPSVGPSIETAPNIGGSPTLTQFWVIETDTGIALCRKSDDGQWETTTEVRGSDRALTLSKEAQ